MTSVIDNSGKSIGIYHELPPDGDRMLATGYQPWSEQASPCAGGKIRVWPVCVKECGSKPVIETHWCRSGKQTVTIPQSERFPHTACPSKEMNKRMVENFIKAGAFDCSAGQPADRRCIVYAQMLDEVVQEKKKNIDRTDEPV